MIDRRVGDVVIDPLESDADTRLHEQSVELELIEQMQACAPSARSHQSCRHIRYQGRPCTFDREADHMVRAAIFGRMETKEHIGLALHVFGGEAALACQTVLASIGSGVTSLCLYRNETKDAQAQKDDISQFGHWSLTTILMAL